MARAKEFDEDAVLLKAMRLFWEKGYEKTSMMDLVTHMGIHKRSIYDTFGDKHSLYMKALKRYSQLRKEERLIIENRSAGELIRLLLESPLKQFETDYPKGCLMVNTAVELALHDSECRDWVIQGLANSEQFIRNLIELGQQSGELDKTLDAELLSYYFNNALIGLRVMVKTTNDIDKLQHIIETTMSILKQR